MESAVTSHNPYAGYVMSEPEMPVFMSTHQTGEREYPVTPAFEPSPIMSSTLPQLLAVMEERKRQMEKWGAQDYTDSKWVTVLAEEVGEVAEGVLKLDDAIQTTDKQKISDALEHLRLELIQAAAVAVAHAEKISLRIKRIREVQ